MQMTSCSVPKTSLLLIKSGTIAHIRFNLLFVQSSFFGQNSVEARHGDPVKLALSGLVMKPYFDNPRTQ